MSRIRSLFLALSAFTYIASICVRAPHPVHAQALSITGRQWSTRSGAIYDDMVEMSRRQMILDDRRKALLADLRKGNKTGSQPTKPSPLLFRPVPEPIVADAIANAWGETAADKKELSKAFRQSIAATRVEFGKIPGDSNPSDLAKAFALYVDANYTVLHPGFTLSDAASENLLREFRAMLESSLAIAKATDKDKQSIWETLVIESFYILTQNERALNAKDKASLKACVTIASEGLKAFFAVPAERVALSESELPLSIIPEVATARADPSGDLHSGWMSFPLPSGWNAEQAQTTLILTPNGLKPDEKVQVFVLADKPGQISFITGAYSARTQLGPSIDFAGEFQTGNLANGWGTYTQPLKIKPSGTGTLLQINAKGTNQIIFVITLGNNPDAVQRTHAAIADHLGKTAHLAH